jgi:hypothetical protein
MPGSFNLMKSFIRKSYASKSDVRKIERFIFREWRRPQGQLKSRLLRADEIPGATEDLKMTWLVHS